MSRRKKFPERNRSWVRAERPMMHVAFFYRVSGLLLDHEVLPLFPREVPFVALQLTAAYWEGNGSTVPSDIWLCWSSVEDLRIFELSQGGVCIDGVGRGFGFDDPPEELSEAARVAIAAAVDAVCRGDYRYCVEGGPQ